MNLQDFVWVDITPETFPALPANLATKADVDAAKALVEAELAAQNAAIGAQIISVVGAEQLVNDAISATVALNATTLVELQNANFAVLNTKIDGVTTNLATIDSKVNTVDSKVTMVDTRVTDAATATTTKFAQVDNTVSGISTTLATTVSTLGDTNTALSAANTAITNVSTKNDNQDLVLTQLVKAATNTHSVLTTLLDSIN